MKRSITNSSWRTDCGAWRRLTALTTSQETTVADPINGDKIIAGRVTAVTDGFDANNLPYTDITVAVSESLKGNASGYYTFRQIGLAAPRDMGNGRTYVGVSPDGFPRFSLGEDVVLFLFKKTSLGFSRRGPAWEVTHATNSSTINNRGLLITHCRSVADWAEQKMPQYQGLYIEPYGSRNTGGWMIER
jgi:hypothetical protein